MPSTSHVLDEARDLLKKRLAELDDERKRLERALGELGEKATSTGGRRGPGRPSGVAAPDAHLAVAAPAGPRGSSTSTPRRRRKNTRSGQAVELVKKTPGISAAEIAKSMKIKPNYLYRVLGELEKEGQVKKKGRQYFPALTVRHTCLKKAGPELGTGLLCAWLSRCPGLKVDT